MTTEANPGQITIGGDLRVNRIGYGAMKLTGDQVWGPYPDHDHALRVLRGVVEAGDFVPHGQGQTIDLLGTDLGGEEEREVDL